MIPHIATYIYLRLSYFGISDFPFLRFNAFIFAILHMLAVGINIYYIVNFIKIIIYI